MPMRRLGIYFFYDEAGIVDEYNIVLLRDLRTNLEKLLVVCNGELTAEGKKKFLTVADEVLVRENRGFDVWAYKEGMAHIGWEALGQYDELVLLNFTNMGPVYPLRDMFEVMSRREVDFWGIVMRYGLAQDPFNKCKYGCIPDHIPSAFLVIRQRMVCSREFQDHWDNMPEINSYGDSICYHEAIFTKDFADKGFKYDLYVDASDLKDYWDYPLMLYPLELVKNRKCPLFKRKNFYNGYWEFISGSCGEASAEFYEYLRHESGYDVDLIWETLLRTVNMADIKDRMQLNYILPKQGLVPVKASEGASRRVALLLHIYFADQIGWCRRYAASMPPEADIYVSTDTEAKRRQILEQFQTLRCNRLQVNLIKNRGRDVSALLIGGKEIVGDYDYVCCAHDKKSAQFPPLIIGQSFAYKCFENVLGSRDYVDNVLRTFDDNPRLGLLGPPPPQHSVYVSTLGNEWEKNYAATVKLAGTMGLKAPMDAGRPPIAPLGGMFWFRTRALQRIFEHGWVYEDFPAEPVGAIDGTIAHAIERIYPFVAQAAGYYAAWGLTDQFARLEITNLNYIANDFKQKLKEKDGHIADYHRLVCEKDRHIARLHQAACEKDGHIVALSQRMYAEASEQAGRVSSSAPENAQQQLYELESLVHMLHAELVSVYKSKSWRLTKPLRWIANAFRHFG